MWCWRRLLRVLWTARRFNQSILKEISPGISLEGMMLKLKLQYFGHLMRRVDSLEKTLLLLGGIVGRRRRGRQRMRGWMASLTWWTWVWVNSGSWWWTGRPGVLQLMGTQRVGHDWATKLNWTELKLKIDPSCVASTLCVHVCSVMSNSLQHHGLQTTRLLCPVRFSRQESWSGLPLPSAGDLPNPGIKAMSDEGSFFYHWATREAPDDVWNNFLV